MAADTERAGAPATAGEYWRIAAKAAELIADLEGTDLAPHWQQSLQFLVRDAQQLAGAECVHEVAQDGQHAHINNDGQPVTTAEDRERCTYRPPIFPLKNEAA